MNIIKFPKSITLLLLFLTLLLSVVRSPLTSVLAQQPTDTPASADGIYITVISEEFQINVRMGPSSSVYPIVGTLPTGSVVPALGRSQGGDWIQIEFPGAPNNKGWVYAPLVSVSPPASLKVVEPPPTPPQPPTSTIDPTLAAQFSIQPTTTRMPTFTPAPPVTQISFNPLPAEKSNFSVPLAAIIIAFAILGLIGLPLSLIRK